MTKFETTLSIAALSTLFYTGFLSWELQNSHSEILANDAAASKRDEEQTLTICKLQDQITLLQLNRQLQAGKITAQEEEIVVIKAAARRLNDRWFEKFESARKNIESLNAQIRKTHTA